MSMRNSTFHERTLRNSVIAQSINNTTAGSVWVDARNARRITALINIGATDTIVDAKLQQATDSSGTGAKDITDAAITQVSATGDNKQKSIDIESNRMDAANGFYYVKLLFTVGNGTTGAVVAGELLMDARHQPVSQPAAYNEQVVVAG